jgi:PIN domain nuclease of toxin-antitoxin system
LDTHTFIWATLKTSSLGKNGKEAIYNRNNEICVSTVSFWEISLKTRLKYFSFENVDIKDFPNYAKDMGFTIKDMQEHEAITFHELPMKDNHKDPFDRMLIWQAITRKMVIISKDGLFEQYSKNGLKMIW